MTGTLTVGDTSISATVITVKSSHERGTYIQFVNGTTPTVEVGYDISYGAYLYNDKLDSHPTLCLGLADNLREAIIYRYAGVNYNVWHSGSLKPYQFTGWSDARSVNHVPNDYNGLFIMRGIKELTTIGLSDSGAYATVWGWRGWADSSGGQAWEIASTNEDLYTRHGHTTSWSSWAKILNSSNYKDYMHDRFGTSGLIVYSTTSDEINFGGTDFYVNYRGASYGGRSVPKKWYWQTGSGSSWANMEFGDCTLHGWINSTGISASGANSFNVGARFSNTSNDSIEIVGGNYTMGLGCHSNGSWFWWRGTANPTISTNKSYVMAYDGSTWAFTGSITATAAITAKATSDFRLKENYDGLIDYRERLLKLGRVYDYNYNKKALDLYQDRIDNKRHTGLVYQNAVKAGITNFCHEKDEYGYGSLNYLSPDLIATIIGSVQANILSIRLVESEQERMRKELEHAKSEINRLKGLVASLQN